MKHYLLVLFTVGFLCFSCSDETSNDSSKEKKQESQVQQNSQFISMNYKEDTKFKKYVTSFAHQLEYYDLIGKINLQSILAKSLAKNDVLINAILSQFENNINNVLNNNPIYFCLKMDNGISINLNPEDLLEENDIKGSLFVFTEVKDIEITKKEIEKFIGIQFTQKDGFYSAHNDQTIFIINNELLLTVQQLDNKSIITEDIISRHEERFSQCLDLTFYDQLLTKNQKELLFGKSDILFAYGIERTVANMIKQFNLPMNKGLENLVTDLKDCYNQTGIIFEKGKMTLSSRNILSDTMDRWQLFKENTENIVDNLGKNNPAASFAMNMNVDELQSIYNLYIKQSMKHLNNQLFSNNEEINSFISKRKFKDYFHGALGASLFFYSDVNGNVPHFNANAKLGDQLLLEIDDLLQNIKLSNGMVKNKNNLLIISTKPEPLMNQNKSKDYLQDFSKYGSYPLNAYINLKDIPWNELIDDQNVVEMLSPLSKVKIYIDNDTFKFIVETNRSDENFLTTIVNELKTSALSMLN